MAWPTAARRGAEPRHPVRGRYTDRAAAPGPRAAWLLLKNETLNPTWSWKDRPACISISMAKQLGFARVAAISTGNHGSSTAAYAAAAGLACVILCHPDVSILQCAFMTAYGARVVRGGNQEALLKNLLDREGYFPCTILCPRAGYSNPYGIEGFKTIAFEIYERFGRGAQPHFCASWKR